jgi:hypothetical protein
MTLCRFFLSPSASSREPKQRSLCTAKGLVHAGRMPHHDVGVCAGTLTVPSSIFVLAIGSHSNNSTP